VWPQFSSCGGTGITKNFGDGFVLTLRRQKAQHLFAERNDCDCRSYFPGALARKPSVIDPVETGFPGAGKSRETQFFITACETANRRIPAWKSRRLNTSLAPPSESQGPA
jgi:hypothetical protein